MEDMEFKITTNEEPHEEDSSRIVKTQIGSSSHIVEKTTRT